MKIIHMIIICIVIILIIFGIVTMFSAEHMYGLTDDPKFDAGTSSNHSDIWVLSNEKQSSLNRYSEYSTFTETTNDGERIRTGIPINSTVEFDLMQKDGGLNRFCFSLENINKSYLNGNGLALINGSLNNWYHIVIEVYPNHYTITGNNITQTVDFTTVNDKYVLFNFWLPEDITTIQFKNFKVTPH